jgi:hypothetical protein
MSEKTEKTLLMAYSVLDELYNNGCVMQIHGRPAFDRGGVLSVGNPETTYIPLKVNMRDPKLLPFAFGQDPVVLVPKVTTAAGSSSTCAYDLWAPDAGGGKAWKCLSRDVVLVDDADTPLATNPNGLAQAGNLLFLVDYDSQKIYTLGANELNGLPSGNYTPYYTPFDVSGYLSSATARGQDVIAMKGPDGVTYVFALFIDRDSSTSGVWGNSTLVMMRVVGGTLVYETQASLGLNAQEIIPVASDGSSLTFLIPCYGGEQQAGVTNGTASMIQKVVVTFGNPGNMVPMILITGDPPPASGGSPTAYDIRALAARLDGGWVYVLCGTMKADYTQDWTIYKADLAKLLAITSPPVPPPTPPAQYITLSEAANKDGPYKIMDMVDGGAGDPGNYWDICIEGGIDITGDRLWLLKGSDIKVTGAEEYGDDVKNFNTGYGAGEIGGINVNCVAFIAETLRQAALGLSMKRGLYGAFIPMVVNSTSEGETVKY